VYAAFRLLLALYCVAVLIASSLDAGFRGRLLTFPLFFPSLTYIGLTFYIIFAAIHTWIHAFRPASLRATSFSPEPPSLPQGQWFTRLHFFLYIGLVGSHVVVPFLFLVLVYNWRHPDQMSHITWVTIWREVTNFVVTMCEVWFGQMVLRQRDLVPVLLVGLLYTIYMWIIRAATDIWVYEVLSFSRGPSVVLWYMAGLLAFVISFFMMSDLHRFRDRLVVRWGKGSAFRSGNGMEKPPREWI